MMKNYLILTEKPSARRNFEKALGGKSGQYKDFHFDLTNLRGHVLTLAEPEKQVPAEYANQYKDWKLENLPWDLSLFSWHNTYIKGTNPRTHKVESTKTLLDNLRSLSQKGFDAIVIATDTDPSGEGELLAWEAILAIGWQGQVLRAHFMDESPKSIKQALDRLDDVSDFTKDGEFQKGQARSRWDYTSMQLTRVASIAAQQEGLHFISRQGRLKSAMLLKIYQQLEAIKNYKKVLFYEVRFKDDQGNIYKRLVKSGETPGFRYPNQTDAEAELSNYSQSPVQVLKKELKQQEPPKLLDLSSLSALLSKEGFQAKEVLATYQKMYEDQVVSYPRTEDKTITPEQFNDLLPQVDAIAGLVGVDPSLLTHRTPRKSHVKAEGAHGANRPGSNMPESLAALSKYGPSASRIYDLLSRNYLAMLAENYEYEHAELALTNYPDFTSIVNTPVKMNWKLVFSDDQDEDETERHKIGTLADPFVFEGSNTKPKAPTWKWLKTFLEKHDIGTGATRTSTYAELSSGKDAYIKDTKGKINLTEKGLVSAFLVQDTYIANPKITKRIFDILDSVGKFEMSADKALETATQTVVNDMPVILNNAKQIKASLGQLKDFEKAKPKEKVTGTWNGKEVNISKAWGTHKFTEKELENLLEGETIEFEAKSKAGKTYTAKGKLAEQSFKGRKFVGFKLDQR